MPDNLHRYMLAFGDNCYVGFRLSGAPRATPGIALTTKKQIMPIKIGDKNEMWCPPIIVFQAVNGEIRYAGIMTLSMRAKKFLS